MLAEVSCSRFVQYRERCSYSYIILTEAWIAGDLSSVSEWAVDDSDEFHFVSLQRQLASPISFAEVINRPQDAIVYYAANKVKHSLSQVVQILTP